MFGTNGLGLLYGMWVPKWLNQQAFSKIMHDHLVNMMNKLKGY